ncbi:DUF4124 domain-containing protein [Shewanella corallii]|uniref:DUF4124 domain-containing protein n=1 Tax=Shewanella corallii TaxID=560080 RepID=A0ABT0NBT0_9GAMM|nr:DUF4124 domain-containing protein [Shewanella corallii]MCL2915286.1 DUF4124 domain-containing protein [Shewanella corallii]
MKYPLLILLLLSTPVGAAVYKWVDEHGNVHYSDTPVEGAQQIELKDNTHNTVVLPKPIRISEPTEVEAVQYQLQISTPEQEATVRNNNGDFSVSAMMTPEAPNGSRFQLMLDGKEWGSPRARPVFQLRGIDRGEHTIAVKALNAQGQTLTETEPRVIFLHRATYKPPRPQPRSN